MNVAGDVLLEQYRQGRQQWPVITNIEVEFGLPPFLLWAEASRETNMARAYAEGQVHADGHGWGLFGADDRWNTLDLPYFASDPEEQARLAARTLTANFRRLGSWVDAVNAYGPSWARGYEPEDYGPDVLARAEYLATHAGGAPPVKFVSRSEWGAADAAGITLAPGMTRGLGVHWLGGGRGPTDHSQCAAKMREVQAFHMGPDRGWADFAYNDAACCHGYVFEGRGPGVRNAANGGGTYAGLDANAGWASVLYLAGTDGPELTPEGADAINDAAEHLGVATGEWLGHSDFLSTECPGDELYVWAHTGHPRSSIALPPAPPAPPASEPTQEETMYIADGPPEVGGGIYVTDGDRAWGVPNEAYLHRFFFTGLMPHAGTLERSVFFELRDRDGLIRNPGVGPVGLAAEDLDEGVIEVAGVTCRSIAEVAEASPAIETGDPGCSSSIGS